MYRNFKTTSAIALVSIALALPMAANAGGYGSTAVRDGAVANSTAGAKVPCPRLGQNVPASLAAQMDCGTATPRVAGERVRNSGGLFSGHDVGSAPPANSDDDGPRTKVLSPDDGDDTPTGGGDGPIGDDGTSDDDGPTDGGEVEEDGGDGPSDGNGPKTKAERLNELGIGAGDVGSQSESFQESFNDYLEDNGFRGDWSGFNPAN